MESVAVRAIPPEAMGLVGVVVVASLLLRIFPDLQTVFFLVPGHTTTRPWQVLSAGYFEDSFLNLLLGLAALLGCGVLLRPIWGGRELLRFVVLANALQGCMTWVGMIVLYILFREEHFLFARLGGVSGLIGALSVAAKQYASGDASLALPLVATGGASPALGSLVLPALAHAPSIALAWTVLILLCTHSGPPDELLFSLNGIFAAWAYLRYYQPREAGVAGDPSSGFAFACLFPQPLQPPLHAVGEATFVLVSMCGCFPPDGWASIPADGSTPTQPVLPPPSLPDLLQASPMPTAAAVTTSDPEVAERRRERARALIEARLAQKTSGVDEGVSPAAALGTPVTPAVSAACAWTPTSTPGNTPAPHVDTPVVA